MTDNNTTRGKGFLENFLTKKRAYVANKFIPINLREGRILDIGCGRKPFFLLNVEFKEKYGLDPWLDNLDSNKIILKKFDIEKNLKLPFEKDFFNIVTMLAVIEHLKSENLVYIMEEIKRVLKKDGRFILTTPCFWTNGLLKIMAKLKLVSSVEIEEHNGIYNRDLIINYLEKAGFERKKIVFGFFELFLNSWFYVDK